MDWLVPEDSGGGELTWRAWGTTEKAWLEAKRAVKIARRMLFGMSVGSLSFVVGKRFL